jgi:hypothetical protein
VGGVDYPASGPGNCCSRADQVIALVSGQLERRLPWRS